MSAAATCRVPGCTEEARYGAEGEPVICAEHFLLWLRAPEAKRASAALMDFVNRIDAEQRNRTAAVVNEIIEDRIATLNENKAAVESLITYVEGAKK